VHVNVITIKKGFSRGGHSHPYAEIAFVAHGRVIMTEKFGDGEYIRTLESGNSVNLPANIPYYFTADEDSVLIEVRRSKFRVMIKDYKPYRDIVEKKMEDATTAE
jgi:quercetin dioxygenase-like cupin family protein